LGQPCPLGKHATIVKRRRPRVALKYMWVEGKRRDNRSIKAVDNREDGGSVENKKGH